MRHPCGARLTRSAAVLGLDLGTSQVKALLCAPDGTVLGQGTAGYQVSTPRPGWAETDPEHWWQAACTAVRAAAGPAPAEVVGLAVAGQMHGVILCTERSVALRPAITWLDRRAEAEAGDYQRLPEDLRARLGNAPSAGMAGPILLWLSRHEPGVYGQARWMLQPKDWLRLRLTGPGVQAATDPTDASGTLLFDLARGEWATDVARALGLRTDLLPTIRQPAEIAGPLLPAAAEHLGLRSGLPVAIGAADTAASLLAAHLPPPLAPSRPSRPSGLPLPSAPSGQSGLPPPLAPSGPPGLPSGPSGLPSGPSGLPSGPSGLPSGPSGLPSGPSGLPSGPWGLLTLGTGGQLIAPVTSNPDIPFPDNPDQGRADHRDKTNLFRSADGGTYRLAAAQNVGVTLDWVRRILGASWEELYETATRPWRADTPVFLPYLAGERWDHRSAGGAWTGLTLAHQREDLLRAALEGVAFLLRGKLDDLRAACPPGPAALRLAGGGSRPPAWRQLLADALDVPLYPDGTGWLTARGAAQLAAAATGLVPDASTMARSDQKTEAIVPASQLAEPSYRRFRSAAPSASCSSVRTSSPLSWWISPSWWIRATPVATTLRVSRIHRDNRGVPRINMASA